MANRISTTKLVNVVTVNTPGPRGPQGPPGPSGSVGGDDITRVSGSGTVAGITLSGDTTSGDATVTLGGTFSTTTSSITDFNSGVGTIVDGCGFTTCTGDITVACYGTVQTTALSCLNFIGASITQPNLNELTVTVSNGDITRVSGSGNVSGLSLSGDTTSGNACLTLGGTFSTTTSSITDFNTGVGNIVDVRGFTTCIGTVTSIGGTGTVSGLTLSGTVTSTGNLTLGGTFATTTSSITDFNTGVGAIVDGCGFDSGGGSGDFSPFITSSNDGRSIQPFTGSHCTDMGRFTTIAGGLQNTGSGVCSFIGAGSLNYIDGNINSRQSFIGAGQQNTICTIQSAIVAGNNSTLRNAANWSFIGAGTSNTIEDGYSFIGSGFSNDVEKSFSSILGGCRNRIASPHSFIGGGIDNTISTSANSSSIAGGSNNSTNFANTHILGSDILADKANYTYVQNIHVTGSTTANGILQLTRRETTPTAVEGMIIASGSAGSSKVYYYNGTSWNALF